MSESILEEAQRLIHGERSANYGHPRDNFAATAALWNAYIFEGARSGPLTSHDVGQLMVLLKVARQETGYHRDSTVDMAGYAGTLERLQEPNPSYHYVLHTEDSPVAGSYSISRGGETERFTHDHKRMWDQVADIPKDGSVTQVRDAEGFLWERRGRKWGWYGSDDTNPIWHHTRAGDLKDRGDGPFEEVK